MKFLNLNKVLCLSPHPDDVEYGMLGTIIKYRNTKFDIFVLSEGGDFDDTVSKKRHQESKNALYDLDNVDCNSSTLRFVKDKAEDEWVNIIETKYDIDSYDCIFCPPNKDSHFDHRFINQFSPALVRGSKCGIVNYRTPSTLDLWIPNLFVDLTKDMWKDKQDRLNKFTSQTDKSYFQIESLSSFHSNYGCSKRRMNWVESFKIEITYV
tara:strand:- start:197 stop:823 length:627 start_codon:yes stop_codon:yes gene_type:complete